MCAALPDTSRVDSGRRGGGTALRWSSPSRWSCSRRRSRTRSRPGPGACTRRRGTSAARTPLPLSVVEAFRTGEKRRMLGKERRADARCPPTYTWFSLSTCSPDIRRLLPPRSVHPRRSRPQSDNLHPHGPFSHSLDPSVRSLTRVLAIELHYNQQNITAAWKIFGMCSTHYWMALRAVALNVFSRLKIRCAISSRHCRN